jgi:peptidoglycan/LPS O-acetylase OafA/YrhL
MTLFYIVNWIRAFGINRPELLGHTWSLSIEEQYYILWPATLIVLTWFIRSRKWLATIIFSMALLSWLTRILLLLNGSSIERVYNGLDTRIDSLLVGCVLGVIVASGLLEKLHTLKNFNFMVHYLLTPISVAGLVLIGIFTHWRDPNLYYWILFVVELFGVLLILDILTPGKSLIKKFLELRVLVWIGSISYGLYLWHYPIIRVVDFYLGHLKMNTAIVIPLTFIIATFSYYLIEKPILRLKKRYR